MDNVVLILLVLATFFAGFYTAKYCGKDVEAFFKRISDKLKEK